MLQDATNLLNLIEAIGEDEETRQHALDVRSKVRNQWAHQEDMRQEAFDAAVSHVMDLVLAMPLHDGEAAARQQKVSCAC